MLEPLSEKVKPLTKDDEKPNNYDVEPEYQNKESNYVEKTMERVEKDSKENYELFINSEFVKDCVKDSIRQTAVLDTLLRYKPTLSGEVHDLIPDFTGFSRGAPPNESGWEGDYQKLVDIWRKQYNDIAEKEMEKEDSLEKLLNNVFDPLNTMKTDSGEYLYREKFNQEVRQKTEEMSEIIINLAKSATEKFQLEDAAIIMSVRKDPFLELLKSGTYKSRLEGLNFPESYWNKIFEAAKLSPNEPNYSSNFNSLVTAYEHRRVAREISLGIADIGNTKERFHPVYAEVVVLSKEEGRDLSKRLEERGYGGIAIKFKEKIQQQTVFCTGDSVSDKSENRQLSFEDAARTRYFLDSLEQKKYVDPRKLPAYIEAHIMGGVKIEDIDECIVPKDNNEDIIEIFKTQPNKFSVEDYSKDQRKILVKFSF